MTAAAIAMPIRASRPAPLLGERLEVAPGFTVNGVVTSFARNAEIFAQEEDVECFYKVIAGAVRITRLLADGRRHVVAFHLPGEIFGLEAGDTHQFSAEAMVESRIFCVRRGSVVGETRECEDAPAKIWRLMALELGRAQEHALVLGRLCAEERILAFLNDLAARQNSKLIDLPMSRIDIADYLGLTIETVSRTLTHLERTGVIAMANVRRIELKSERAAIRAL